MAQSGTPTQRSARCKVKIPAGRSIFWIRLTEGVLYGNSANLSSQVSPNFYVGPILTRAVLGSNEALRKATISDAKMTTALHSLDRTRLVAFSQLLSLRLLS